MTGAGSTEGAGRLQKASEEAKWRTKPTIQPAIRMDTPSWPRPNRPQTKRSVLVRLRRNRIRLERYYCLPSLWEQLLPVKAAKPHGHHQISVIPLDKNYRRAATSHRVFLPPASGPAKGRWQKKPTRKLIAGGRVENRIPESLVDCFRLCSISILRSSREQ